MKELPQIPHFIYGPHGQNILHLGNLVEKKIPCTTVSYTLLITFNYSALKRQKGSPGKIIRALT